VEFSAVEVHAVGAAAPVTRQALRSEDFISGARVAELSVDPGTHEVRVSLLRPGGGAPLAERVTRVDVSESQAITVLIVRGAEVDCTSASDCGATVGCAEAICSDGICLTTTDDSRCAPSEWCNPDEGCVALPILDAGVDSGPMDSGTDTGSPMDSGGGDTTTPDAGSPDTGSPDTGAPDAGGPGGLVARYTCESVSGGSVPDVSGSGHDGMCAAGRCPTTRTTMWGHACDFDGADFVRIASHADFTPSGAFTLMMWVRPDSLGGSLFGKVYASGPENSWQVATNTPGTNWAFYSNPGGGVGNEVLVGDAVAIDMWTHVAAVFDGSRKRLFFNATERASRAASIAFDGSGEVLLGADWSSSAGNEYFFDGEISDIRFYDRALSAAEIRAISGL